MKSSVGLALGARLFLVTTTLHHVLAWIPHVLWRLYTPLYALHPGKCGEGGSGVAFFLNSSGSCLQMQNNLVLSGEVFAVHWNVTFHDLGGGK